MNPNDGKAYSLDDEDFRYETAGAALDALDCDGRLIEGEVYFEVDTRPVDLADYMDAEWLLEDAANRAYDDLGECAEDAFDATEEAIEELDAALKAWAAKHLSGRYWRCVGKSRVLKVTAEDVTIAALGRMAHDRAYAGAVVASVLRQQSTPPPAPGMFTVDEITSAYNEGYNTAKYDSNDRRLNSDASDYFPYSDVYRLIMERTP